MSACLAGGMGRTRWGGWGGGEVGLSSGIFLTSMIRLRTEGDAE